MMKNEAIIGLRDLRENTEDFISKIKKGWSFLVLRKSKPVFKIVNAEKGSDGEWEEVLDFTKIKKGGVKMSELLSRL